LRIELLNIAKRFRKEWVFRELNLEIQSGSHTAVLGNNGSGKSTLLQLISGYASPSDGQITWQQQSQVIPRETIYRHVAICSPAIQIWDDLTLRENIDLFQQFKKLPSFNNAEEFAQVIQLERHVNQPLKTFSSGMKQRVKLGLAILSDADLLLLDEPCSHLDSTAVHWFQQLVEKHTKGRTVVIASNRDQREIFSCSQDIDIHEFKR
jgi:ABC-type multidrug transport system ATPase subunit